MTAQEDVPEGETHRAVLKHAVKDWAVCFSHRPQVEAPHLQEVLVLVVGRHAVQEVHILCKNREQAYE